MHLRRSYLLGLVMSPFLAATAAAAVTCPAMPAAVTTISKDVKSDINLTVGGLGKLKAGDLGIKTEVASKNLFEKYPNVDRLLTLQTMAATYCQMLNSSTISDGDRLDRWEKFQDKVLELQSKPDIAKPKSPSGASKPVSRLSTDRSIVTIPTDDCFVHRNCPHPFAISFSRSGDELAYGTREGDVRIWSVSKRKELDRLSGLKSAVEVLSYDSAGDRLIGASSDGTVVVWEVKSGRPLVQLGDPQNRYVNVAWSARLDRIAVAPLMGETLLWKEGPQQQARFGYTVRALDLSADGATVASNQFDGSIVLRSESDDSHRSLVPKSERGYTHIRFNQTGQTLTAGDGDGILRQWSVESGELTFSKVVPGGGIRDIVLCPNDSCIAVIALNGGVFLYDGSGVLESELSFKNRPGSSPWSGKAGTPWSLAVSQDGRLVGVGSVNGEVIVWERTSKSQLYYGVGHLQEQVVSVQFSPDGKLLASACFDGTVKIWQLPVSPKG